MGKMKFGFQVQLNCNIFLAILRLPPRMVTCARQCFIDNLADSMVLQRVIGRFFAGIAQETFLFLQMGHDAESFGSVETACR